MARIVFSSCHNEYLRIGKVGTAYIGPNSGRFDWTKLAKLLVESGFDIAILDRGLISKKALKEADILVLGQPESYFYHSKPPKSRTTTDSDKWGILKPNEIEAIKEFVTEGGGLLLLQEKHSQRRGNNLNDLANMFGIEFQDDMVECDDHYQHDQGWVFVRTTEHPLFEGGITKIVYFNGCSSLVKPPAKAVGFSSEQAEPPNAPLITVCRYNKGKVVAMGDATLFSEWGLGPENEFRESHARFIYNLFSWLPPDVYWQEKGNFLDASIQETTPGVVIPVILREISSLLKKLDDADYPKQKTQLSRLLKMTEQVASKIGAERPPIIQSILVTLSEFIIVVAGFMLAYILTKGLKPVSLGAVTVMLLLSLLVIFLLKVIEFWKGGRKE